MFFSLVFVSFLSAGFVHKKAPSSIEAKEPQISKHDVKSFNDIMGFCKKSLPKDLRRTLVLFDVDDTLITDQSPIDAEQTNGFIKFLKKRGAQIVLVTQNTSFWLCSEEYTTRHGKGYVDATRKALGMSFSKLSDLKLKDHYPAITHCERNSAVFFFKKYNAIVCRDLDGCTPCYKGKVIASVAKSLDVDRVIFVDDCKSQIRDVLWHASFMDKQKVHLFRIKWKGLPKL